MLIQWWCRYLGVVGATWGLWVTGKQCLHA